MTAVVQVHVLSLPINLFVLQQKPRIPVPLRLSLRWLNDQTLTITYFCWWIARDRELIVRIAPCQPIGIVTAPDLPFRKSCSRTCQQAERGTYITAGCM